MDRKLTSLKMRNSTERRTSLCAERQEQAQNHGKLRVSKVQVVSMFRKGTVKCQVRARKANTSEPSDDASKY